MNPNWPTPHFRIHGKKSKSGLKWPKILWIFKTKQPDFSLTCGYPRVIARHVASFSAIKGPISELDFLLSQGLKMQFLLNLLMIQIFAGKSGCHFH